MADAAVQTGPGLRVRLELLPGFTDPALKTFLPFLFQNPVLDQSEWAAGANWDDYSVVGGDTFSTPNSVQLRAYTFQTILTDFVYPWSLLKMDGYTPNPLTMQTKLVAMCESLTPLRLIAKNPLLYPDQAEINLPMTLREVRPLEKGGEPGDRYITMNFVEYRHPELKRSVQGGGSERVKLPVALLIRTLPPNRDSLYELSKFYYGQQTLWKLIAKRNGLLNLSPATSLRSHFIKQPARKVTIPAKPK